MFLIIIGIILCLFGCTGLYKKKQYNKEIEEKNKQLENNNYKLEEEQKKYESHLNQLKEEIQQVNNIYDNCEKNAKKAFEHYCDVLDLDYKAKEQEIEDYEFKMKKCYQEAQAQYITDLEQTKADLKLMQATRAAAMQAKMKEKEIKEKSDFYCLKINENDLSDIKVLNKVKNQLNQPRILAMLIWKTYFLTPMGQLISNVVGTEDKCGIYKITNQLDDCCYIGQSVSIGERWKQHAKCGLGIDAPAANKLYKAMQEDGLQNFSFEILEECPRDQLDNKEKFYIELYQSNLYGYNSQAGNTKK